MPSVSTENICMLCGLSFEFLNVEGREDPGIAVIVAAGLYSSMSATAVEPQT